MLILFCLNFVLVSMSRYISLCADSTCLSVMQALSNISSFQCDWRESEPSENISQPSDRKNGEPR